MPHSKLTISVIFVSMGLLALSANAVDNNIQIISAPPAQFNWETTKEGVSFAPLQGDRFNESYMAMVKLPAGLAHISKCVSDEDCITFLYQDGKFDFLPVEK